MGEAGSHSGELSDSLDDRLTCAVVVATTGRPQTLQRTLSRLTRQSLRPDRVLVVAVTPADVAELDQLPLPIEIRLADRGLCRQRNLALDVLGVDVDLVVFFDDDLLPADDYLENAERLFRGDPDIVGATGRLIADDAGGPGLSFESAEALLVADRFEVDWDTAVRPKPGLYGCNMAYRVSAIGALRFDEKLPLYGWQEDVDFSSRLRERGRLVVCDALASVHMGEKAGRGSGLRLGYSQIANPIYLLRKGTITHRRVRRMIRKNIASNLRGSFRPEPYIDRRGRLIGNFIAIGDYLTGRIDPRRILDLR
jgi:glycosyltransferase involved in cell wall biosynthesis